MFSYKTVHLKKFTEKIVKSQISDKKRSKVDQIQDQIDVIKIIALTFHSN